MILPLINSCGEESFDDLAPHAYLEECLGEGGDDVIVALNQGKTVGTHGFPFLPLLHLVMVVDSDGKEGDDGSNDDDACHDSPVMCKI